MSEYYNPKRTKNLYDPTAKAPFKLSRSKIEMFLNCPRCFYLDRRLGVGQPPGFPFALNSAVDLLLKREFDGHRVKGVAHPMMAAYGLDAVPFAHKDLETWRENFQGVMYHHPETNLIISGAVDDIWVRPNGELIIVDYKSTSKDTEVNLDAEWQRGYKNQMEIYQWLFRRNGFTVSNTGYFVYCNGKRDRQAFDAKIEFDIKLIPYEGDDSWIEKAVVAARKCLDGDEIPVSNSSCDFCAYRNAASDIERGSAQPSVVASLKPRATKVKKATAEPLTTLF
jgi:CRISPR/Cas system-associated exonuclease Cas4 (RecB family)